MPRYVTGVVTAVRGERPGFQRVEVDGRPAYVLTDLIGAVSEGDEVVVNTTAVDLGLGTGGYDVVHWNLARNAWEGPSGGHVLKLRYSSLQTDVGVDEERPDYEEPADLEGLPVVVCGLHSQLACVALALREAAASARVAYVMTDTAALPLALSDLVADLKARGALLTAVTAGQAFGGEHEAVNVASALRVARANGADVVVVAPGPGGVGTATELGFGALDAIDVIAAAQRDAGRPVFALRVSGTDARPRHRGVSHHARTVLDASAVPAIVAVPRGEVVRGLGAHRVVEVDVPDMAALFAAAEMDVRSMGRGPEDDPSFFRYAGAAGVAAARLVTHGEIR